MSGRRTYWHLREARRKPSEYDIASSRLLYYPSRGFEVNVPLSGWYATYQQGSPLHCRDWDGFRDPRETTYARYVEVQSRKETFVAGLLDALEATGYDRNLTPAWVAVLEQVLAPLRYPAHGLQMIAAYVGHMAPGGRIVIAAALQAADEMRRVHLLAYRMRQLQNTFPEFGRTGAALWQNDPMWQPLRALIERLLVTYDWGEAFVALNMVVKPALDELFMVQFARLATGRGDEILGKLFLSLAEDCEWHREWSRALVAHTIADDPGNRRWLEDWREKWLPQAAQAIDAFAPVWDQPAEEPRFDQVRAAIATRVRQHLDGLGADGGQRG